jgi:predicted permease
MISTEYWRGRLGGRPLADLSLEIGRDAYRVIGVLPAEFRFLGHGNAWLRADVWLPLERETDHGGRTSHGFHTIARLSPGVELESARRAMNDLAARLRAEHGQATHADSIRVEPLMDAVLAPARAPLRLLLIASFVVLLVACCNLGASLLARGIARGRELAVRAALGARRTDIARLLLVQAAIIALPGTVLGVAGAWCALIVIRSQSPDAVPRLHEAAMNPAAIAVAVVLALATAAAAGLLPALTLSVRNVAKEFRTHGAATGTRRQRWLWDGFVAAQTALTLVLLVSSAVLVRSLLSALSVDVGYRWNDVVIASITLPERRFDEETRRVLFYDALLQRLRAAPGVDAAGLVNVPPDEIYNRIGPVRRPDTETQLWSGFRLVDQGFFETLEIPVLAGSLDTSGDAVLIDENMASALWGAGARPVGERVQGSGGGPASAVAGVAGSIRMWNQNTPIGAMYVHYSRVPQQLLAMQVLARGPDRSRVADAIRQAIAATDPVVPFAIVALEDRVRASMADRSLMMLIASGFAGVALFLAAAGVYALVAQAVARRRRESGIRLILGAHPRHVRRRVVRLGLRSCMAGIAVGLLASFAAAMLIRAQLSDVAALDPLAFLAATVLLIAAAWLASAIPARRAGRVDPVRLLRDD